MENILNNGCYRLLVLYWIVSALVELLLFFIGIWHLALYIQHTICRYIIILLLLIIRLYNYFVIVFPFSINHMIWKDVFVVEQSPIYADHRNNTETRKAKWLDRWQACVFGKNVNTWPFRLLHPYRVNCKSFSHFSAMAFFFVRAMKQLSAHQ